MKSNETLFTPEMLTTLRTEFAKIERVDPEAPTCQRMMAMLDRLDDACLVQLAKAKIKWISSLSLGRVIRRNLKLDLS